jgi:hypothetical protein
LIGNDLVDLLLPGIGLIEALGQYAQTEDHDDDGRHQDYKKDYTGFIVQFFKLREHGPPLSVLITAASRAMPGHFLKIIKIQITAKTTLPEIFPVAQNLCAPIA